MTNIPYTQDIDGGGDSIGRLIATDPRDSSYPLQTRGNPSSHRKFWWMGKDVLDQGALPHCVAYSGLKYLQAGPVTNEFDYATKELYDMCQAVDEWPGTDYDGTSVRACFKTLKRMGYIKEYRWAYDVQTIVTQLLTVGPVVMGTNWNLDMFSLDKQGFISYSGPNYGGHAYILCGVDTKKRCPDGSIGAFRMLNSWGRSWGQNGRAWISFSDMNELLKAYGEACVAIEIKKD